MNIIKKSVILTITSLCIFLLSAFAIVKADNNSFTEDKAIIKLKEREDEEISFKDFRYETKPKLRVSFYTAFRSLDKVFTDYIDVSDIVCPDNYAQHIGFALKPEEEFNILEDEIYDFKNIKYSIKDFIQYDKCDFYEITSVPYKVFREFYTYPEALKIKNRNNAIAICPKNENDTTVSDWKSVILPSVYKTDKGELKTVVCYDWIHRIKMKKDASLVINSIVDDEASVSGLGDVLMLDTDAFGTMTFPKNVIFVGKVGIQKRGFYYGSYVTPNTTSLYISDETVFNENNSFYQGLTKDRIIFLGQDNKSNKYIHEKINVDNKATFPYKTWSESSDAPLFNKNAIIRYGDRQGLNILRKERNIENQPRLRNIFLETNGNFIPIELSFYADVVLGENDVKDVVISKIKSKYPRNIGGDLFIKIDPEILKISDIFTKSDVFKFLIGEREILPTEYEKDYNNIPLGFPKRKIFAVSCYDYDLQQQFGDVFVPAPEPEQAEQDEWHEFQEYERKRKNEYKAKQNMLKNNLLKSLNTETSLVNIFKNNLFLSTQETKKKLFYFLRIPQRLLKEKDFKIVIKNMEAITSETKHMVDMLKDVSAYYFGENPEEDIKRKKPTNFTVLNFSKEIAEIVAGRQFVEHDNTREKRFKQSQLVTSLNFKNIKITAEDFIEQKISTIKANEIKIKVPNFHFFVLSSFLYKNYLGENQVLTHDSGKHEITTALSIKLPFTNSQDITRDYILKQAYSQIAEIGSTLSFLHYNFNIEQTIDSDRQILKIIDEDNAFKNIKKEIKNFDKLNHGSNTIKLTLTLDKDILADNLIFLDKNEWEPCIKIQLYLTIYKTAIKIEYKNYQREMINNNPYYTFYTTDINNYDFTENIKVFEEKGNEKNELPFTTEIKDDKLFLKKEAASGTFTLNKDNPLSFEIKLFPFNLKGKKSWRILKSATVKDEEVLKEYTVESEEEKLYKVRILENPLLKRDEEANNDNLILEVYNPFSNNEKYQFTIPCYRDSEIGVEFENDNSLGKYFNHRNPELITTIITAKHKIAIDKIKEKWFRANYSNFPANIEINGNKEYLKSPNNQNTINLIAKHEEHEKSHTIKIIKKYDINNKIAILSGGGLANYVFIKSREEKMEKDTLLKILVNLKYDESVKTTGFYKTATNNNNDEVLKQNIEKFLNGDVSNTTKAYFKTFDVNKDQISNYRFWFINVEDDFFLNEDTLKQEENKDTKDKNTKEEKENKQNDKKDDAIKNALKDAKIFFSKHKKWFIIGGSILGGLIFALIIVKVVLKRRHKKMKIKDYLKLLKKNKIPNKLLRPLTEYLTMSSLDKRQTKQVLKIIIELMKKPAPIEDIEDCLNTAILNQTKIIDFSML